MEALNYFLVIWFAAFVARFGWDAAGMFKNGCGVLLTRALDRWFPVRTNEQPHSRGDSDGWLP